MIKMKRMERERMYRPCGQTIVLKKVKAKSGVANPEDESYTFDQVLEY